MEEKKQSGVVALTDEENLQLDEFIISSIDINTGADDLAELIKKTPFNIINAALVSNIKNEKGETFILRAAKYLTSEAFIVFINTCDQVVLNHALEIQNENGWTLLHAAACHQTAEGFMALLNKCDQGVPSHALEIQQKDGWTPLHIAARYQTAEGFMALLNKYDQAALNHALKIRNKDGWTPLDLATGYQTAEAFMALINKCDQVVLNHALETQNKDGWTPLHLVAEGQNAEAFMAFINKCDQVVLKHALGIQKKDGWTPLDLAARCQTAEAFMALINKCDQVVLNHALETQDKEGWTFLHVAASYQMSESFMALINKCDQVTLNHALNTQGKESWTLLLRLAARNQMAEAFMALMNTCDQVTLNHALKIYNKYGWTLLHTAARYQTAEGFMALINKCDQVVLNHALQIRTNDDWTFVQLVNENPKLNEQQKSSLSLLIQLKTQGIKENIKFIGDSANEVSLVELKKLMSRPSSHAGLWFALILPLQIEAFAISQKNKFRDLTPKTKEDAAFIEESLKTTINELLSRPELVTHGMSDENILMIAEHLYYGYSQKEEPLNTTAKIKALQYFNYLASSKTGTPLLQAEVEQKESLDTSENPLEKKSFDKPELPKAQGEAMTHLYAICNRGYGEILIEEKISEEDYQKTLNEFKALELHYTAKKGLQSYLISLSPTNERWYTRLWNYLFPSEKSIEQNAMTKCIAELEKSKSLNKKIEIIDKFQKEHKGRNYRPFLDLLVPMVESIVARQDTEKARQEKLNECIKAAQTPEEKLQIIVDAEKFVKSNLGYYLGTEFREFLAEKRNETEEAHQEKFSASIQTAKTKEEKRQVITDAEKFIKLNPDCCGANFKKFLVKKRKDIESLASKTATTSTSTIGSPLSFMPPPKQGASPPSLPQNTKRNGP